MRKNLLLSFMLLVTATGKNANGQTIGELDFYLADYRYDGRKNSCVGS